jgi:NAD(P)-dependent dehydrogenase (short-subunit alcohol dehydrogenase family)
MLRTELHRRPCAWTQPTTSNRCLVRRDRSPPIRPGHSTACLAPRRLCRSKHAVVGMIRQLAAELGPDIRVNGVAPGGTMTDLRGLVSLGEDSRSQFANPGIAERIASGNPLRTVLMPDDLAGAYVFLASRRNARGITGSIVTVDAGAMLGALI